MILSFATVLLLSYQTIAAAQNPGLVTSIPFRWTPGQIEIAVSVNGRPPVWFIVDTGAEFSILSTDLAKKLALRTTKRRARDFADGISLSFHGIKLEDQKVMVMPFENFRRQGRAIQGVLGYGFFERYVVVFDYIKQIIDVHDPRAFRPSRGAAKVTLQFSGRLPVAGVEVEIPGRGSLPVKAMVDTGASQTLLLRHPFAKKHDLLALAQDENSSVAGSLIEVSVVHVPLPATRLTFAKWSFADPVVKTWKHGTASGGFADTDGLIGNELLGRFRVTIDYSRKALYLEPNERLRHPFTR